MAPTHQRRFADAARGSSAQRRSLWPRGRLPGGPTADAAGLDCAKSKICVETKNVRLEFSADCVKCIIITDDKNAGVTTTRVMFSKEDDTQKDTPKKTKKGLNAHASVFVPASSRSSGVP